MTDARMSRRSALGLLGAAGAAGVLGAAGGYAAGATPDRTSSDDEVVPFHGRHQAGITTTVQQHLYFASFDMTRSAGRKDLQDLLADWTIAAERLTRGLEVAPDGAVGGGPYLPPKDTGEALGLHAHSLTLTFGFGPTLFAAGRFGIENRRPTELAPLPSFAFDLLEDRFSGGDLCIQACADDPQVAVHAIRNLTRIGFGRAQVRWTQLGYGRTSTTTKAQATPRNLFGFKDGTANIFSDAKEDLEASVWADGSDQPWLDGGSFLVARKIQMLIESWDRVRLEEQESIIGRDKAEGAPLSGGTEFTEPDFDVVSTRARGPAIPERSHVRLAHPSNNKGARLLRRGYNYVEGNNELGQINAGLFFLAFCRSPQQFIDIQRSLATDALNEYIRHVGSALFAIPRGVRPGEYIGDELFS